MDEKDIAIIKQLVRDPRMTDTRIARNTGILPHIVASKRQQFEESGAVAYYTRINQRYVTGRFNARHLYIIRLKLGHSTQELFDAMLKAKVNMKPTYMEHIRTSYLGEAEGHAAIILILEGRDDEEIAGFFNSNVIPDLKAEGGPDVIDSVTTMRLSHNIRLFHNYLPFENMDSENGRMKKDWSDDLIFVD